MKLWESYPEWMRFVSVHYFILCTLVCKAPSHLQWRKIVITVIFMKMFLLGSFVLPNICKFKLRVLWKIVIGWYSTQSWSCSMFSWRKHASIFNNKDQKKSRYTGHSWMDLLAMKNEYYSWAFHENFFGILAILL